MLPLSSTRRRPTPGLLAPGIPEQTLLISNTMTVSLPLRSQFLLIWECLLIVRVGLTRISSQLPVSDLSE